MKKIIIGLVVLMFILLAGFIISMSSSDLAVTRVHNSLVATGISAASSTSEASAQTPPKFKNYILTRAENKTTLHVHPDDEILLRLGDGQWTISLDNQEAITNITNLPAIEGIQGILKAVQPGTVHLEAKNEQFSISITIIVE